MTHDHVVHTLVFNLPSSSSAQVLVSFTVNDEGEIEARLAERDEEWHSWGSPVYPVRVCDREVPLHIDAILADLKAREGR